MRIINRISRFSRDLPIFSILLIFANLILVKPSQGTELNSSENGKLSDLKNSRQVEKRSYTTFNSIDTLVRITRSNKKQNKQPPLSQILLNLVQSKSQSNKNKSDLAQLAQHYFNSVPADSISVFVYFDWDSYFVESTSRQELFRKILLENKVTHIRLHPVQGTQLDSLRFFSSLSGTQVVDLNLAGGPFSDSVIDQLSLVLPFTNIQSLDLSGNLLRTSTTKKMIDVLPDTQIQKLNLGENHISPSSLETLFSTLPQTRVRELKLNHIQDDIFEPSSITLGQAIQKGLSELLKKNENSSLSYLGLSDLQLENKDVIAIASASQKFNLLELDLSKNKMTDAGIQEFLYHLPKSLQKLNLDKNHLSYQGIKILLNYLSDLNLSGLTHFSCKDCSQGDLPQEESLGDFKI